MNSALVHVPEEVCEKSLREIADISTHVSDIGAVEFQAFMPMLDHMGAGYRE